MLKRLFKNNWAVGIGTGVLATLLLRGIDKLFINDALWEWVKGVFNVVVNFFNTDYTVKLYFLILLPILVIAVILGVFLLAAMWKDGKGSVSGYPAWADYTKDVFGDVQYRWRYDFIGKRYEIMNLQRYCNECSCLLVDNRCPVCRTNHDYNVRAKSQQEVLALIVHRIDTGLYRDSAYFNA